jgi:hypothetical protein
VHFLTFKCRICGRTYSRPSPQPLAHLMSFHQVSLVSWHECGAGQQGVTDLIGGNTTKPEEPDHA